MSLRLAVRRLLQRPGHAAVTILMLAVGIGANTTLFSIADAVLLRPLPFRDQERLVIAGQDAIEPRSEVSYLDFQDWRARVREFDRLTAIDMANSAFKWRAAEPRLVAYRAVAWDFFDVMGVRPMIGRTFDAQDDRKNAARVAIVSHAFWQGQLGGDPAIAGRTITLDEPGLNGAPGRVIALSIVGVMPPAFRYPEGADLWTPLVPVLAARVGPGLPDFVEDRGAGSVYALGRLRPGADVQAARADLNRIISQLVVELGRDRPATARVTTLTDELVGPVRAGLWSLVAAAGLLLLVACANVAGLVLVQTETRRREYAIRLSLGASPADLRRQLFWDTSVLVACSTAAAVLVSRAALPVARFLLPSMPRLEDAATDLRVVLFTVGIGAASAVVCWLAPAASVNRLGIDRMLRRASTTVTPGGFRRRAGRALVIGEVAVAVVSLTAAGLLVRSVSRIAQLDLGFSPQSLLSIGVDRPPARQAPEPGVDQFAGDVIGGLAALPSVASAAAISPPGMGTSFRIEGQSQEAATRNPFADVLIVTPGYFNVMQTPLRGRDFGDRDLAKTAPVVIVNESLARRAWPGQDPVGKRLYLSFPVRGQPVPPETDGGEWWEVIGVAADIRYPDLATVPPAAYFSNRQSVFTVWRYVARTSAMPLALDGIRRTLRQASPSGVIEITQMIEELARLQRPWRASRVFFVAFAVLTLLLAVVGVYATMAAGVVERSREIGVRLAIGATAARIVGDVMREGLLTTAAGAAMGVGLSALASRAIGSLLFGISPTDALALSAAPAVLVSVAMAACLIPALRASRLDPATALRES